MPARCTSRATRQYKYHVQTLRPSVQVRLHGDRQPLEGGALGAGSADRPLCQGGREILRRAGQPPRQLRLLRLVPPSVELGARRAEEGHRRHMGARSPASTACGSAYRTIRRTRGTGFRPRTATIRKGPWRASRTTASRTKEDGKGKWWEGLDPQELYTGPNIVMPTGITTIAEAQRWHDSTTASGTRQPPAEQSAVRRELVPALPGPGRQVSAGPALFR